MSRPSSHLASSISLVSSAPSSGSDNYYTCTDEMDANQFPSEEFPSLDADSEAPDSPLDAEADELEQPSVVLIYSADTSPVASLNPSPCPLPSLPSLISPPNVDHAMQTGEHDFRRYREWATLVVWDPHLPGAFSPDSSTSILPPWWRGEECHGTFGYPAFMHLPKPISFAGRFASGDSRSDHMEGRPVWDPSVFETPRRRARWTYLVQRRRIAILDGSADREY